MVLINLISGHTETDVSACPVFVGVLLVKPPGIKSPVPKGELYEKEQHAEEDSQA